MDQKFNIRVYGICIRSGHILVSDERLRGYEFTKFPGGGLEFGEGTIECLIREMKEETQTDFNVISHFYTTDFFQPSAFHPNHQIISVYYLMSGNEPDSAYFGSKPFDFKLEGDDQKLRWISLDQFSEKDLSFPIDKKVAGMILKEFS